MISQHQTYLIITFSFFSCLFERLLIQPCSESNLQRGDGLVLVHQVRHDGVQRALPLAGGAGTGAGVRPELAQLFVLRLLGVRQSDFAARRGVFAGEED